MARKKKTCSGQDNVISIPKGRPKSGRIWKSDKKRFSSIKKDKPFNTSWKVKMQLKRETKLIKEQDKALKEAKKAEKQAKKERRADNIKRREENAKKAEIVQKITNTAKLKRMKKKQLKLVEKR